MSMEVFVGGRDPAWAARGPVVSADAPAEESGNGVPGTAGLLSSDEPSVRWKVHVRVLGEDPSSLAIRRLQGQVRRSERVHLLLSAHQEARPPVYAKWCGAHWVLAALADLGYPSGDPDLAPLRDSVLEAWLHARYFSEESSAQLRDRRSSARGQSPPLRASQQGSALLSIVRLGLDDGRGARLVERLLHWQWPDGGWNCDVRPAAASSSVHETLLPMRGLTAYAQAHSDSSARDAACRAAEVLLSRRLAFGRSDGRLIDRNWARLRTTRPTGLRRPRGAQGPPVRQALPKPTRGARPPWTSCRASSCPRVAGPLMTGTTRQGTPRGYHRDHVDWGGSSTRRMNEWVTADALMVLAAAGRPL